MNVSLTKELQKFVQDKVKSGLYRSSSEVIRDCVRRFKREEAQLTALRQEIDLGLQDIEEGRVVSDIEVFNDLRRRVGKVTVKKGK